MSTTKSSRATTRQANVKLATLPAAPSTRKQVATIAAQRAAVRVALAAPLTTKGVPVILPSVLSLLVLTLLVFSLVVMRAPGQSKAGTRTGQKRKSNKQHLSDNEGNQPHCSMKRRKVPEPEPESDSNSDEEGEHIFYQPPPLH